MRCPISRLVVGAAALLALLDTSAPTTAIDRKEILEQMRQSRPQDLKILIQTPDAGGDRVVGIYGIKKGEADPNLRRYSLWEEWPRDLNIYLESVNCNPSSPVRVKRTASAVYIRTLNPGGIVNETNLEDHLVWWAACVPELAGTDPATLREQALSLGYSTLIPERQETLPAPAR